MTQDKMRRIVTACVSAATVLLVLLLGVLVYQWIKMGVQDKKIKETKKEIVQLEEDLEQAETLKDQYLSDFYLQWRLEELGLLEGK